MTWHNIQHWLSETLFLSVLVSPLAFLLATAIGLGSWLSGGSDSALFAAGLSWSLVMTVLPVWLRLSCGPDTRMICERCIATVKKTHGQTSRIERRREVRRSVDCRGTFFTRRGQKLAVVADLSTRGCRVKAACDLSIGESVQMLIDLPGTTLLKVSQAIVRWTTGEEWNRVYSCRKDR